MKASVAVHKFSSCDGCQLAFLNMGEDLLALGEPSDFLVVDRGGPGDNLKLAALETAITISPVEEDL